MDWNIGFSATYYASFVDAGSWRDLERFEITNGSISIKDTDLMESATIGTVGYSSGERWVRIWMDVRQGGDASHVPLMTGLACSPEDNINGIHTSNDLEIYSVLKPADDILLPLGWYAPGGEFGGILVKDLLRATPAPVVVDRETPRLSASIVAEDGETHLSMAHKILDAIDWRLRIDGDGTIHICPKATEPSVAFDALENDAIEPKLTLKKDWYECPNVFRAVMDGVSAVARDDDPTSPLSTVTRGREIWAEENDCNLNDGESIADYALRKLHEAQEVAVSVSYDRRFHPDVRGGDVVSLHYPKQGITGLFKSISQSVALGHGARTSEEVLQI